MTKSEAQHLLNDYLAVEAHIVSLVRNSALLLSGEEALLHKRVLARTIAELSDGIDSICKAYPALKPSSMDSSRLKASPR
jgi:hypothetical protein